MAVLQWTLLATLLAFFSADPAATVIVSVNGTPITKGDLDFAAMQLGMTDDQKIHEQPKLIEQLIERQLIRKFLSSKKIDPVSAEVQEQIARAEELVRKRGEDPKTFLPKIGYTKTRLKNELELPSAWRAYVRRTVTPEQFKEYFNDHHQEFDGTQLRGSQIFLKLPKPPTDSDVATKTQALADLRRQILDKTISFADAAKQHSEAPTKVQGGDIGLFGWRGKLPPTVSKAAFDLKVGELSEPIQSPFGMHLIQVTERHPGDLSLEDVRPIIFDRLSQDLWKATVADERATAKIGQK
ncbi:peptidylprolyl isomerase [Schlesneria paludicola]|uniref:peptidylprolyl isomerase n=1 Tax=Schlesneria paludicola TaxID=360056 RepID=UPI00029B25B4|nr:peptidylprolyl isomerase [Schlesneria paludicola]